MGASLPFTNLGKVKEIGNSSFGYSQNMRYGEGHAGSQARTLTLISFMIKVIQKRGKEVTDIPLMPPTVWKVSHNGTN